MVDEETIDTEFTEKEETVEDEINEEKSKFDEKKDETKEKIDETREKTTQYAGQSALYGEGSLAHQKVAPDDPADPGWRCYWNQHHGALYRTEDFRECREARAAWHAALHHLSVCRRVVFAPDAAAVSR